MPPRKTTLTLIKLVTRFRSDNGLRNGGFIIVIWRPTLESFRYGKCRDDRQIPSPFPTKILRRKHASTTLPTNISAYEGNGGNLKLINAFQIRFRQEVTRARGPCYGGGREGCHHHPLNFHEIPFQLVLVSPSHTLFRAHPSQSCSRFIIQLMAN